MNIKPRYFFLIFSFSFCILIALSFEAEKRRSQESARHQKEKAFRVKFIQDLDSKNGADFGNSHSIVGTNIWKVLPNGDLIASSDNQYAVFDPAEMPKEARHWYIRGRDGLVCDVEFKTNVIRFSFYKGPRPIVFRVLPETNFWLGVFSTNDDRLFALGRSSELAESNVVSEPRK